MKKPASAEKPRASDETTRSEKKHQAILEAAKDLFLKGGYLGTNMDEIAASRRSRSRRSTSISRARRRCSSRS